MRAQQAALLIVAGVFFLTMGCVSTTEHQKKVNALQSRLENEHVAREATEHELEELRRQHAQKRQELDAARTEAEEFSELSARLQRAKEERERNLQEMKNLVKDISGMRIETRTEGDFIVIENEILFDPGRIELKDEANQTIRETVVPYIKEQLDKKSDQIIRIDGHTDGEPITASDWDDNYHLSVMRAHAVMSFLAGEGIPQQNMFLAGFGPNRPRIEPPEPRASVDENRRVEILLIPDREDDARHLLQELVR